MAANLEIDIEKKEPEIKGNKNKRFDFKYLIEEDNQEIYLFGDTFVERNKDKCYLIIDNIDCELTYKYTFQKKGKQIVTLVIKDYDNIDFTSMFFNISVLNGVKTLIKYFALGAMDFTFSYNNLIDI